MGSHKIFEGSAGAAFSLNEDSKSIVAETGNVSLSLDGITGSFAAKAGIMAMVMDGLGSNICMQNEAGDVKICVNISGVPVITLQLGTLRILINSPVGGVSILVGDIGIMIVGGAMSIAVDAGCINVGLLIEFLLKIVKWMDFAPFNAWDDFFKVTDDFLCENSIPWSPPP